MEERFDVERRIVMLAPPAAFQEVKAELEKLEELYRGDLALPNMDVQGVRDRFQTCAGEMQRRLDLSGKWPEIIDYILDWGAQYPGLGGNHVEPLQAGVFQVPTDMDVKEVVDQVNLTGGNRALVEADMIVGDQHSISGSPAAGPMANRKDFDLQWAMGSQYGIALDPPSPGRRTKVHVGVFDSSPYNYGVGPQVHEPDFALVLGQNTPAWLQVTHPAPTIASQANGEWPFADHGLSVASLIHRVAPEDTVHLIRVLNDHLEGDGAELARQIIEFVDMTRKQHDWRTLINLSLHANVREQRILHYLLLAICCARANDIAVFAAAGNASEAGQTASDALFPASLPNVIGVAASSLDKIPAWFSNKGNVLAPGCGVVAMINKEPPDCDGFVYVSGTSFATPLVTGLAALELSQGMTTQSEVDTDGNVTTVPIYRSDALYERLRNHGSQAVITEADVMP